MADTQPQAGWYPDPATGQQRFWDGSNWTDDLWTDDRTGPTKVCPYCGESVLVEATKCKHCGEWLDAGIRRMAEAQAPLSQNQKVFLLFLTAAFVIIIVAVYVQTRNSI